MFGFGQLIDILKKHPRKIVFTEGSDPRILEASSRLLASTFLAPVLVGNKEEIAKAAEESGFNIRGAEIIDPLNYDEIDEMVDMLCEIRKNKGMTQEALAEKLLTDKSTISLYENDKIDIKSSVIAELAKVLGCTGGYLLEGSRMADANEELLMLFSKIKSEKVKAIAIKQLEALISLEVE